MVSLNLEWIARLLNGGGPGRAAGTEGTGGEDEGQRGGARNEQRDPERQRSFHPSRPIFEARCLGGTVELYTDRVRIKRDGLVNYMLRVLGGNLVLVDTVIPVDKVAAVEIAKPIFWNAYLTIAYPGSPPQTGSPLVDATAENAIFLNFFDNRSVYDLVERLQARAP